METGGSTPTQGDWRAAFDGALDAHYLADAEGRVLVVNQAAADLHRRTASEIVGRSFVDLGLTSGAVWQPARSRLGVPGAAPFTPDERQVSRADGGALWVEFRVSAIQAGAGHRLLGVARDVTSVHRRREQLEQLAYHDTLTGLTNLAGFRARLRELIVHGLRDSREGWALLLLDLDHFKEVNDSLGHMEGDRVLRAVADRIEAGIRASDHAFRVGGDEFAVVARHLAHPEDAAQVAQNLLDRLGAATVIPQPSPGLAASVGIACYPRDGDTAGLLLRRADSALYAAKSSRGCYRFWARDMDRAAADRLSLRHSVAVALERGELSMVYQPIHRCGDPAGGPTAVEGLIRWQPAGGAPLSPGSFVDMAEEIRVMQPIGEWVLRRACEMASRLQRSTGRLVPVGVNLSAVELARPDLVGLVMDTLGQADLTPEALQLEFTTESAEGCGESGLERLRRLADSGVSLALDDVGAGQFPYGTLRDLPVRTLKIDGELISRVTDSELDARIVRSLVQLARGLGAHSLAEAVETEAQIQLLREFGCELVQGFATGRPQTATELLGRLGS
jgi:diguanylate cyclase (GGDEF)-like protein/PAS domain S-box-containing protein